MLQTSFCTNCAGKQTYSILHLIFKNLTLPRNVHYLKPDKDWTEPDGRLVERYYFTDFLHLVEEGYEKFANSIYEAIVKVSQGNVVGSGTEESENESNKAKEIENKEKMKKQRKTWLRTANDPEANPDQQHYHPKHN